MKKSKLIWLAIFPAIFLLYLLCVKPYLARLTERNYKLFYESHLNGRLSDVSIRNQGSSFKLNGAETVYVFYPYADETLNARHAFSNFAKPGDLIIKPAFSDTLVLFKDNKSYQFTFRKFKLADPE